MTEGPKASVLGPSKALLAKVATARELATQTIGSNVISLNRARAFLADAEEQATVARFKELCLAIGPEMQATGDRPSPHQLKLGRDLLLNAVQSAP